MIEIETNIPSHGEKHQSDVVLEFLLANFGRKMDWQTKDSHKTHRLLTLLTLWTYNINNNINSQHYEGLQISDRNSHPLQEGN